MWQRKLLIERKKHGVVVRSDKRRATGNQYMNSTEKSASLEFIETCGQDSGGKRVLPVRSELLENSSHYPPQLRQLKDVPKKLHVLGSVELLRSSAIAIVGARKATTYGLECAERFARKAALRGITVVSGGAIGCDMAAHKGALAAGGSTIVVLGSGADVVYPLRARQLFHDVLVLGGALISEAPWGSPPISWAFSRRNRIIAALAKATLIVEAGLPSGTFQTADHTLALGNEVLVVPGPIFSKTSKGSNRLLAQGALPIVDDESFEDALSAIFGLTLREGLYAKAQASEERGAQILKQGKNRIQEGEAEPDQYDSLDLHDEETQEQDNLSVREFSTDQVRDRIIADLCANPMTIDALAQSYERDAVEIIRIITKLEVQGVIERLRDGRYTTRPR